MNPEDVLNSYGMLINRHDFDLLKPMISEDAVFWFNDGSHSAIVDIRWLAKDERTAGCIYRFRWQAMVGGEVVSGGGRGTTLLREESGVWRIIHEHLSQIPR